MSGDGQGRHHLLLVVVRVAAVVEGADRGRVVEPASGRVAEVVADEACGRVARAEPVCRVQLRVPAVLAQADVAPEGAESRCVELDAGVYAIVGGAIRRGAWEVRVHGVQRQAGVYGLLRTGTRAGKSPVIEVDAYSPARGHREVGLELVDRARVVVHLDRRCPGHSAVVGGG